MVVKAPYVERDDDCKPCARVQARVLREKLDAMKRTLEERRADLNTFKVIPW